ncbi:hypothetical protein HY994_00265 [Candidatus Micrarchaeota archaeon]|nr:hypothetical protein [Candidatus Micrarchaeota archaeon]
MRQFRSRQLQNHLKELARNRGSVDDFSKHLRDKKRIYSLQDAILALNGLQQENVLQPEQIIEKKGSVARSSLPSSGEAPVQHGLNALLWEQTIREGDLTSLEKQRIRELYVSHAHFSLFRPSGIQKKDHERSKALEKVFQKSALDLTELDRFSHLHGTATKVMERVRNALEERKDTPHRQVMNSALTTYHNILSHLQDVRENQSDFRRILGHNG